MTEKRTTASAPIPEAMPALLVVREGRFYLLCRTLGIAAEGGDPAAAYADLVAQRKALLARYARAGLAPPAASAGEEPPLDGRRLAVGMLPFALKTAIVGVVAALFVIWASSPLTNAMLTVRGTLQTAIAEGMGAARGAASPRRIAAAAESLAATLREITPERRETLRQSLRTIAVELEPYLAEIRPLYSDSCACPKESRSSPALPSPRR